jgi:hypothetical protein
MTALRVSQLGSINVLGGVSAGLRVSQLGSISVLSNPAAAGLRVSQLGTITVTAYGQRVAVLGPPIKLGCWTPCGVLIWNHNGNGRIS